MNIGRLGSTQTCVDACEGRFITPALPPIDDPGAVTSIQIAGLSITSDKDAELKTPLPDGLSVGYYSPPNDAKLTRLLHRIQETSSSLVTYQTDPNHDIQSAGEQGRIILQLLAELKQLTHVCLIHSTPSFPSLIYPLSILECV